MTDATDAATTVRSFVFLFMCVFEISITRSFLSNSLSHPYRENKVQSEVLVPKVILAGRCSKSSAVTGTVVVRAVRGSGGITVHLEENIVGGNKI